MTGKSGNRKKKKGSQSPKKTGCSVGGSANSSCNSSAVTSVSVCQKSAEVPEVVEKNPTGDDDTSSDSIPVANSPIQIETASCIPPPPTSEDVENLVVDITDDAFNALSNPSEERNIPHDDEIREPLSDSSFIKSNDTSVDREVEISHLDDDDVLEDPGNPSSVEVECSVNDSLVEDEDISTSAIEGVTKEDSPIKFIDDQDINVGESSVPTAPHGIDEVDFRLVREVTLPDPKLFDKSIPLPPQTPSDDEDFDASKSYQERFSSDHNEMSSSLNKSSLLSEGEDDWDVEERPAGIPIPPPLPARKASLCQAEFADDDITDFLVDGQDGVIMKLIIHAILNSNF